MFLGLPQQNESKGTRIIESLPQHFDLLNILQTPNFTHVTREGFPFSQATFNLRKSSQFWGRLDIPVF
jgi:hypothetical protein